MPTPIKVKGKGTRKRAWAPPDPNRFKQVKRQRINEDTPSEESTARVQPGSSSKIRRKHVKTKKPAALIEQLPTELLEHIFLLSENLNFPRSSLRIGYILSHPSLLLELTVAAFTPTWKVWLGCQKSAVKSYCNFIDDHDRFGGNPDFQSDVLACRWMNISLLHGAQQVWQRRNPSDVEKPGAPPTSNAGLGVSNSEEDLERFKNQLLLAEPGSRFMNSTTLHGHFGLHCYLEKHPLTRVPNHLLTGPFDWDKVKLLFWLVRSGATVMPSTSPHYQSWEVCFHYSCSFLLFLVFPLGGIEVLLTPSLTYMYLVNGAWIQKHRGAEGPCYGGNAP